MEDDEQAFVQHVEDVSQTPPLEQMDEVQSSQQRPAAPLHADDNDNNPEDDAVPFPGLEEYELGVEERDGFDDGGDLMMRMKLKGESSSSSSLTTTTDDKRTTCPKCHQLRPRGTDHVCQEGDSAAAAPGFYSFSETPQVQAHPLPPLPIHPLRLHPVNPTHPASASEHHQSRDLQASSPLIVSDSTVPYASGAAGDAAASASQPQRFLPSGQFDLPTFTITPPTPPPPEPIRRTGRRRSNEINQDEHDEDFLSPLRRVRPPPADMSMNFPSFLDSPAVGMSPNQLTRGAATPSPAQHVQANGLAGAAAPMGGFPPNPGHQMDLNHLWNTVQELSAVLQTNRTQTQHIVGRVEELRNRASSDNASPLIQQVNGEISDAAKIAELETRIAAKDRDIEALNNENNEMANLLAQYEAGIGRVTEMVRHHCFTESLRNIAIHQHYNEQLTVERQENLQLRLEHADWQGRLGNLAENVRLAYRHASETDNETIRTIAELRNENRVLRLLHGLPVDESDDEEQQQAQ
ncbi:hypothetical protein L228DRAFT_285581 [Xylona heveae TC161]|uniref:Uncharacterized protein n=1 Tax=Xylona heveae (strain CBS 132557 / TC161) TaxID=1328760 RepID=A0A164ZWW8_XYLHT|nr:hypothetical protein L228DRAFT_285581 [Xylona heveae TC161]KZF19637.1 hypothetical protein L228DRAFT_285581 [Xylona heveae TC161]